VSEGLSDDSSLDDLHSQMVAAKLKENCKLKLTKKTYWKAKIFGGLPCNPVIEMMTIQEEKDLHSA
jgi:hypothetical protein